MEFECQIDSQIDKELEKYVATQSAVSSRIASFLIMYRVFVALKITRFQYPQSKIEMESICEDICLLNSWTEREWADKKKEIKVLSSIELLQWMWYWKDCLYMRLAHKEIIIFIVIPTILKKENWCPLEEGILMLQFSRPRNVKWLPF